MIATVGFGRPDMFHTDRDQTGRRRFLRPEVSAEQLALVRTGILRGLDV